MVELEDSPTEYTATYAKKVATVQDAFAFVMTHMDKVGAEPSIAISPFWLCVDVDSGTGEHTTERFFEVCVSGMVEIQEMA